MRCHNSGGMLYLEIRNMFTRFDWTQLYHCERDKNLDVQRAFNSAPLMELSSISTRNREKMLCNNDSQSFDSMKWLNTNNESNKIHRFLNEIETSSFTCQHFLVDLVKPGEWIDKVKFKSLQPRWCQSHRVMHFGETRRKKMVESGKY